MPTRPPIHRPPGAEAARKAARQQYDRQRPEDKAFYTDRRWRVVARLVRIRDGYLCQQCKREGRTTIGKPVDHIKERKTHPELSYVMENLETLCQACHNRKTHGRSEQ